MKTANQLFMPASLFIWQAYLLVWICGSFFAFWPVAALCCLFPLLYGFKKLCTPFRLFLCLLVFISAACLVRSQQGDPTPLSHHVQVEKPLRGTFCGKVSQFQGLADRRVRLLLSDLKPEKGTELKNFPGFCSLTLEEANPFFNMADGLDVCFSGILRQSGSARNFNMETPASFRNKKWTWQAHVSEKASIHISGQPTFFSALREKLRKNFLIALGFNPSSSISDKDWHSPHIQAKAILLALCFGDRRLISTQSWNNFASASLAHSLALSGQHLGIVTLLAILAAYALVWFNPSLFLRTPRPILATILASPLACLYLWIGNSPASLLRAAGMLFLATYFICRKSAFTGMDLLAGTLLCILLLDPLAIFDTGLQLSTLCVALIILFAPCIKRLEAYLPEFSTPLPNRIMRGIIDIFLISLIIQTFLLPLNILNFSIAGLYFPLNLLWLPLLGLFVMPLSFFSLLISILPGDIFTACAYYIGEAAALPCQWLLEFLDWLRSLHFLDEPLVMRPHWLYLPVFAILAPVLAWLMANNKDVIIRKKIIFLLIVALLFLGIPPAMRLASTLGQSLSLDVLDVGQGLSLLLKAPGNMRIIYDAGGSPNPRYDPGKSIVAPFLAANSNPRLDAIINSHPDLDHLEGLLYLLDKLKDGKLFHNGHDAHGSLNKKWLALQQNHDTHVLYAGDSIGIGDSKNGLRLEVIHPPAGLIPSDDGGKTPEFRFSGNDASLVLRLCKGDTGLALLTGDAEKETLEFILKSGKDISARVLIAPHHGSDRSLVEKFYRKVDPQLVLVGCGFQNRWAYPGKKLKSYLATHNIPLLDTGNSGRISVFFEDDGQLSVEEVVTSPSTSSIALWLEKLNAAIFGNEDKKR